MSDYLNHGGIDGRIRTKQRVTGEIKSKQPVTGSIDMTHNVSGSVNGRQTVTGNADIRQKITGSLAINRKLPKELRFLPRSEFPATGQKDLLYIDTTNNDIYYWNDSVYIKLSGDGGSSGIIAKTTQQWASETTLVSEFGEIYIWTDYRQEDGVDIPAMKIGDGRAYVIDLPFFCTGVTEKDRENWNNKVSAMISPFDNENLLLYT